MTDEEDLRRQMEELVRLYGELLRRLSHQGLRGVPEMVTLYQQLRRAIDSIGYGELDWALGEIGKVLERLHQIGSNLGALGEIKRAFSGPDRDPGEDPG